MHYYGRMSTSPPDDSTNGPPRNSRKNRNWLLAAGLAAFLTLGTFAGVTYQGARGVFREEQRIEQIQKQNNERRIVAREIRAASKDLENAKLDIRNKNESPERFVFTFEAVAQRLMGIRSAPVSIEQAERERAEKLNAQFVSLYIEAKKKYYAGSSDKERYDALDGMLSVLEVWAEALENLFGRTSPKKFELMVRAKEPLRSPHPPEMKGRA
jgi:hypothetical protein